MLRKFKKNPAVTTATLNPNHLSEDEMKMLIALYLKAQREHPAKKIMVTLKPSSKLIQRQYAFNMASLTIEGKVDAHNIEVSEKIVIKPTKLLTPSKCITDEDKRLLKCLVNSYPLKHLLSTHDPVTNQPTYFLVAVPASNKSTAQHFQLVRLTQNVVKYARKKNAESMRYAICQTKQFANGARGFLHKSKYTLKFTSEDHVSADIEVKKKIAREKRRVVKFLYPPTDVTGELKRLPYSLSLDRSDQNKLVKLESHFLAQDVFFHVKAPIFSADNYSPAIVMRCGNGRELRSILNDDLQNIHIIPVDPRILITIRMMEAVLLLHAKLIIHRDLKPENFLIAMDVNFNPTFIKIVDYGLSCYEFDNDVLFCGTPDYLPPEIAKGLAADRRCDTYSFMTMLAIDIWSNLDHHKYKDLSDSHKSMIAKAIELGTHKDRRTRAPLSDALEVFKRVRDERDDLREMAEQVIEISTAMQRW